MLPKFDSLKDVRLPSSKKAIDPELKKEVRKLIEKSLQIVEYLLKKDLELFNLQSKIRANAHEITYREKDLDYALRDLLGTLTKVNGIIGASDLDMVRSGRYHGLILLLVNHLNIISKGFELTFELLVNQKSGPLHRISEREFTETFQKLQQIRAWYG